MRTTIDMPDDLMRAAKVTAAEHGESLKDLVSRAVAHEIGVPARPRQAGRVSLPLVGREGEPTVVVSGDDIEAAFDAEDVERYGR
jgi:hypothetical protein